MILPGKSEAQASREGSQECLAQLYASPSSDTVEEERGWIEVGHFTHHTMPQQF